MFICEECHKVVLPKIKVNRKVVATREKQYRNGSKITQGWEIVKESAVCPQCV